MVEEDVLRFIYTVLFYLALPFIFLRLLWRSRVVPDNRRSFSERLGFFPAPLEKCIWVHAVSVGETLAAIPLIKALQAQFVDIPVLVTNMTVTGKARVKAVFGDSVLQALIPYDLPNCVMRFLDRTRPRMVVIIETELWPNLFAACQKRNIPIVVMNARLSEKSAKGYKRISSLTHTMLSAVHGLASQGYADAKRFIDLGLPSKKVIVTGNLKFDLEIPASLRANSEALHQQLGSDRLIWIAASTHASEEDIILAAHRMIRKQYPTALLILVPRHPDRFESVAISCEQQGFRIVRRSHKNNIDAKTSIYLGDTMGELLLMYSVADVAFVGGSFTKTGGHNMLEPAALHKPIVTGPHIFNFEEISQMLLQANGMSIVKDADDLAQTVLRFFGDHTVRHKIGEQAYQVVAANRGAVAKQMALIKSVWVKT